METKRELLKRQLIATRKTVIQWKLVASEYSEFVDKLYDTEDVHYVFSSTLQSQVQTAIICTSFEDIVSLKELALKSMGEHSNIRFSCLLCEEFNTEDTDGGCRKCPIPEFTGKLCHEEGNSEDYPYFSFEDNIEIPNTRGFDYQQLKELHCILIHRMLNMLMEMEEYLTKQLDSIQ